MAEWTGLEPATSGVTGQHSNRLNYHSAEPKMIQIQSGRRNRSLASRAYGGRWLHVATWQFFVVGAEGIEPPTLSV